MKVASPILGVDFGDARIGLAISDDLRMLAHPLETVPAADREAAIARIVEVIALRKVETVVMGLPLRMDGSEGTAVERVRKFSKQLQSKLPETVSIAEIDERLTTVAAWEKMHAAGRTEKNSRAQIDQAAAVEILQDYLNSHSGVSLLSEDDDADDWEFEPGED